VRVALGLARVPDAASISIRTVAFVGDPIELDETAHVSNWRARSRS